MTINPSENTLINYILKKFSNIWHILVLSSDSISSNIEVTGRYRLSLHRKYKQLIYLKNDVTTSKVCVFMRQGVRLYLFYIGDLFTFGDERGNKL